MDLTKNGKQLEAKRIKSKPIPIPTKPGAAEKSPLLYGSYRYSPFRDQLTPDINSPKSSPGSHPESIQKSSNNSPDDSAIHICNETYRQKFLATTQQKRSVERSKITKSKPMDIVILQPWALEEKKARLLKQFGQRSSNQKGIIYTILLYDRMIAEDFGDRNSPWSVVRSFKVRNRLFKDDKLFYD